MRYEELPGPLSGWTYDEHGVIHTASGYKTTARQIEFCMWMYDCMRAEVKQWMIRSDERPGALRPLFDPADLESSQRERELPAPTVAKRDPDQRGTGKDRDQERIHRGCAPTPPKSATRENHRGLHVPRSLGRRERLRDRTVRP